VCLPVPAQRGPRLLDGALAMGWQDPVLAAGGAARVHVAAVRDVAPVGRGSSQPAGSNQAGTAATAVGELATVRALLSWGRSRTNLSAAEVLQLPAALLSARQAAALARQLQRAGELCDQGDAGAVGVCARGAAGFVRVFACPEQPVLLMAAGGERLWADGGALVIEGANLPDGGIGVSGWHISAGRLRVSTPAGELDLTKTPAGGLLTALIPGVDEVVVREAPLRSAFAALFATGVDVARKAAARDLPLAVWHEAERR